MNMPIKWLLCAIVIVVVAGFWLWRKNRMRASAEEEPASIVVLLQKPRPLNVQVLAQLLSQASGRSVRAIGTDDPPDRSNRPVGDMVAGASPHFIANVGGTSFVIHNLSSPYVEDPIAASETISDLRLRKAMREHKAWISMDVLKNREATSAAYRVVARVMANFAGPDCLALYHPPLNRLVPCTEETVERLKSDDPIKAVFQDLDLVPVIPIEDDPRLRSAEAEARRRFPEFEAAFTKKDGTNFSVKARISSETNSEHIWVAVDTIARDVIRGRLGNEPVDLGQLKIGSKVEVQRDKIEDWSFMRGGAPVGLFTVPVIQEIEAGQSSKK